ncbi:endolytic transglycosylase MltG [bacterium]|nr:MAG: endolytic transglycosylase MltG [bacterium]
MVSGRRSGRRKSLKKGWIVALVLGTVVLVGVGGGAAWLSNGTKPVAGGKEVLLRYEGRKPLQTVLNDLQRRGIVRDARAASVWARLTKKPSLVPTGTYRLRPGQTLEEIVSELQKPIRHMVRIPETNWAARTSRILEREQVCSAASYMELVKNPAAFEGTVSFPLPKDSLEGYLYPDTYDLPPLLGARGVIERQLENFEKRVWKGLKEPKGLARIITIGSLVEMEVAVDSERPMVAGVVENRMKKGMRLQIDAAINYGLQKWRPLTLADYKNVVSPYNLYLVDGLPPTPICSPTVESIEAAITPAKHDKLYYVALPDKTSLFSATYEGHLKNVAKRRAAIKALEKTR